MYSVYLLYLLIKYVKPIVFNLALLNSERNALIKVNVHLFLKTCTLPAHVFVLQNALCVHFQCVVHVLDLNCVET